MPSKDTNQPSHDCVACGGSGEIRENVGPSPGPSYPVDCPDCGGTGTVGEPREEQVDDIDWKSLALEENDE